MGKEIRSVKVGKGHTYHKTHKYNLSYSILSPTFFGYYLFVFLFIFFYYLLITSPNDRNFVISVSAVIIKR